MLVERLDAWIEKQRGIYPCHTNRASELGHECLRYLVFLRTRWQEAQLPDLGLQYIFNEGNHQEKSVYRDLTEAGVTIYEQQVSLHWKNPNISCALDGKTKFKVAVQDKEVIAVVEVKSMSPFVWKQVDTADDMLKNPKYPHLRKYPAQIQIGMILANLEWGLFLLKNKQTGKIKEILMSLDLEYTESLVKKAENVNRLIAIGETPPPIPWNERLCGSCKFNHICAQDQIRDSVQIIDDSELLSKLDRRAELASLAEEHAELDDEIKDYFRGKERSIVGNWLVFSKKQERKDKKEVWNTTFTKIKEPDHARALTTEGS